MSLSKFAVTSPVKVAMIFVAILILGFISLRRLPTNLFPDIRAPRVTTTIKTVGLSPSEVEKRINERLERELYTITGVTDVETIARADSAIITTEFTWETPLDFAFLDVKKVVGDVQRDLSEDIDSATVLRFDPNAAPVVTIAIRGSEDTDPVTLQRIARDILRPRFERIEGVANVVVAGGLTRQAQIRVNESLMTYYELTLNDIKSALEAENVSSSGGTISEASQTYQLRAEAQFRTLEQIEDVVIKRFDGAPLLLSDVATVLYSPEDQQDAVWINGEPGIGLSFYREAESNTVSVAKAIRAEMEAIQDQDVSDGGLLPKGTELILVNDQSIFIQDAIREVRNNALLGALLASIVLFVFLRSVRTTLIVAISIPLSIITTFNLMYFQGLSLNLMTLGGLALGSGMLVDNAIVVLENIFRLRQQGKDAKTAAAEGSSQVFGAILASTLTTIVVFLPIIYVRGVAGLLFKEQALTVAYSLLASLVVALLLIPMLASTFNVQPKKGQLDQDKNGLLERIYLRMLTFTLKLRIVVFPIVIGLLFLGYLGIKQLPQEFLPKTEQRQFSVRLVLPGGTPINVTENASRRLLGVASEVREAVPVAYARIGDSDGDVDSNTDDPDGTNTADIMFFVQDWDRPSTPSLQAGLGKYRTSDLVSDLEKTLATIPNSKAKFNLQQGSLGDLIGEASAPLMIEISGPDIEILTRLTEEFSQRLALVNSISNVRTSILDGTPEIRLDLRSDMIATTGLTTSDIASALRQKIDGVNAGEMRAAEGDLDLFLRVDYPNESLEVLNSIILRAPDGKTYPLGNLVDFRIEIGPREIVRRQQERVARVMADLNGVLLSEALVDVRASVDPVRLPTGYQVSYTGEEQERSEAFSRLQFTLILSVILVYMVMASVFESFLQPLLIMLTIPLAGVGVVAAFIMTGQSINVMGLIGVVMLGGIVVNNAIVLLDYVNQVRRESTDLSPHESLVTGCQARLRPVLITTLTTLLGLMPMALGIGQGAELRQALAIAVLGGLVSSTVLTLFVIPVAQSYLDSIFEKVSAFQK